MTFEMLTMPYLWMGAVGRMSERLTSRMTVATAIDTWERDLPGSGAALKAPAVTISHHDQMS